MAEAEQAPKQLVVAEALAVDTVRKLYDACGGTPGFADRREPTIQTRRRRCLPVSRLARARKAEQKTGRRHDTQADAR